MHYCNTKYKRTRTFGHTHTRTQYVMSNCETIQTRKSPRTRFTENSEILIFHQRERERDYNYWASIWFMLIMKLTIEDDHYTH